MAKNFHETIKGLEKKLSKSQENLISLNTKYRELQNKIDKLHRIINEESDQIIYLVKVINELLNKIDLAQHSINLNDVKNLNNVETLILINNAIRILNNKF